MGEYVVSCERLGSGRLVCLYGRGGRSTVGLVVGGCGDYVVAVLGRCLGRCGVVKVRVSSLCRRNLVKLLRTVRAFSGGGRMLFCACTYAYVEGDVVSTVELAFERGGEVLGGSCSLSGLFGRSAGGCCRMFGSVSRRPGGLLVSRRRRGSVMGELGGGLDGVRYGVLRLGLGKLGGTRVSDLVSGSGGFIRGAVFEVAGGCGRLVGL